jgi:hypothetical protein
MEAVEGRDYCHFRRETGAEYLHEEYSDRRENAGYCEYLCL